MFTNTQETISVHTQKQTENRGEKRREKGEVFSIFKEQNSEFC